MLHRCYEAPDTRLLQLRIPLNDMRRSDAGPFFNCIHAICRRKRKDSASRQPQVPTLRSKVAQDVDAEDQRNRRSVSELACTRNTVLSHSPNCRGLLGCALGAYELRHDRAQRLSWMRITPQMHRRDIDPREAMIWPLC
jgi:hypothetical protein